ncbi:MAG: hypothetical protein E7471_06515 [Ruminococcaceae bacterium]|nr:hypothetical protein [Oscillospiraceae bacterium]
MKDGDPVFEKTKKSPTSKKHTKKSNLSWALWMLPVSFALSFCFNGFAEYSLQGVGLVVAFFILGLVVLLGIVFDILGVATTSATDRPLHAMAARRVNGAKEAIWLLQNTEKVASFCNDVVGDIASIISGVTAAVIITRLPFQNFWFSLTITALVAGFTVSGKALGKGVAVTYSNNIVFAAGKTIYFFKYLFKRKK